MRGDRNKWRTAVEAAWLLSAISVLAAVWMVYKYGFGEQMGLGTSNQLEIQTAVNMPVIAGGVFQAVASILFACLFSMLNSIYQNTIDIWDQSHSEMKKKYR